MYFTTAQPVLFPAITRRAGERLAAVVMLAAMLIQTLAPVLLPTTADQAAPAASAPAAAKPFVQPLAPGVDAVRGFTGAPPTVWTPVRPAPSYPLPPELVGKPEIAALRSSNGAVYDLGAGSYAQLQDVQPLHYQDGDGAWQVIDPTFAAVENGWTNSANTVRTSLAKSAAYAEVGTVEVGVAWEPVGIEVVEPRGDTQAIAGVLPAGEAHPGTRSADGRTVRYTGSWSGGVQDQWQIDRGRAEYSLRLPELPLITAGPRGKDAALELRVRLHLDPGTQILLDGRAAVLPVTTDKMVEFRGANGETLQLLPPYAYEQSHFANGTGGEYTIANGAGGADALDLRVRIPWQWLAAPERQYPVIIDPRFQMRSSTQAATARYNPLTLQFQDVVLGGASNVLGRSKDYANRMLVRFDMPFIPAPLPVISKAWLLAAASAVDPAARYAAAGQVTVHTVNNPVGQDWWVAPSIEPAFDLNQPLPPGPQLLGLVKGASVHPVTRWEITNQVRGWLPNANTGQEFNMGLILRAGNEQCAPGFLLDPLCGAMFFNETASNWTQTDLNETQYASTPDNPYTPASESSGLRLLVFYTAATLNPGQVLSFRPISKQALPPGTDPVWNFDHVYNLPAIATDRWRAMVARGFGPVVETPLAQYPGKTMRMTPLAGGVPLTVRTDPDDDGAGYIDWRIATPNKGQGTYVLVNGRGTANINPPSFQLHVGATTDAVQPEGYDVRLINEVSTLQTTLPVQGDPQAHKRTIRYAFDSGDPLALWNLDLPAGSNTEISITVDKDGTVPMSFMGFANNFSAQVIHSTTRLSYPDGSGLGATNRWPLERVGLQPVIIGTDTRPRQFFLDFQPQAGQSALVLAYNGPRVDTFEVPDICLDELCNRPPAQEMRVKFEMTINIISCPAGSYPDADGNCREVRCPTTSMPVGSIQDAGSFRLWSSAGWTPANAQAATSNSAGPAPLIGTAAGGPRVAIIGNVSYDKAASEVTTSANSKAILISCPAPAASPSLPTAAFVAGRGAMKRQLLTQTKAVLRFANITNTRPNPWVDPDRSDLLNADYYVDPAAGTAVGTAELRRRTGEAPDFRDLKFAVHWSWNAQGWASFVGNAAAMPNNPQPPAIASLALGLGSSFALDMQPQQGNGYRTFAALRATQATITQPLELGGASRPVQALLLPRNQYVPSDPLISCAASCIDLRALDDTVSTPNRTWQMPDVHVVAAAGTVLMSAPGMLQVNSIDHPNIDPARAADFAQEYSFDAYKASVSVQQEWCTQEDQQQNNPKVLVVRGETRMALPNIGDSGASPDAAIAASFKLCSSSLRGVHMEFYSPVGVPIGTSGLFLTGLNGSVDIYPEHTRITMGLRFQAAQGGDGGVFTATGEVTIDTLGLFAFQGSAEILGVVDATGKVWVAWNPLDTGFEVTAHVGSWLSGSLRAHMWEGQGWNNRYTWLPDNNDKHFAGEFEATITIHAGDVATVLGVPIPPGDISFGVSLAFGEFCVNSSCTVYEWGIKGTFEVVGYDVGLYYGFDTGLDFILGNDDYLLVDEYGGGQTAPVLAAGTQGADTDGAGAQVLGPNDLPVSVKTGPAAVNGVAEIPFVVSPRAEQILIGLGWQAGAPQVTLVAPDGAVVDLNNLAQFGGQAATGPDYVLLSLQAPKVGEWTARIDNLTVEGYEHYKFFYFANKGAPGAPGEGGFLVPAAPNEEGSSGYTIRWQVPEGMSDGASEKATISLFYRSSIVYTGTLGVDVPIVQNLPYRSGSFFWDTSGLPSASYQIKAVVDDGVNDLPVDKISRPDDACVALNSGLPYARAFAKERFPGTVTFLSAGSVKVTDVTPPATPSGVQATSSDGALLVRWEPAPGGSDVTRYLVRWGKANGSTFTPEEQRIVTAGAEPRLRLGAVKVGQAYGIDVTALDASSNPSNLSAPVYATPAVENDPVPLAPVDFHKTGAGSDSASFAWTPGGGAAPAFYRLDYIKLGQTAVAGRLDVNTTSAAITGLETGATYDVRLYAGNADGWLSTVVSPTLRVIVSSGVDGNGDGMPEDWAAANGVTDGQADGDGDGLANAAEYQQGSDPLVQDSDGDGYSDGEEQAAGSDPLDGASHGGAYLQPRLLLGDDQLHFKAKLQAGGEAPAQSVAWANGGGGSLTLQAAGDQGWIVPSVVGNDVQVAVATAGLQPGFYSGVVRLSAAGGAPLMGDPACIRVNAWVLPADNDVTQGQDQAIEFGPLIDRRLGEAPFALAATTNSGLPVSFTSLTPAVCTIAGTMVTLVGVGQCTISATQPGNGAFGPAPSVIRSFSVVGVPFEMPVRLYAPIISRG